MKLVTAEKPSVGIAIAKVIGANHKKDGFYEGNGYIVSWCVGHLIGIANPASYDDKYKKWNMKDLPIFPKEFKYEITKSTKKQFDILKQLLNNKSVNIVINACDAGREGELIFRLVYMKAGCNKKIERLWISSMEETAIKKGFENLKNGKEYENLFSCAETRAKADWLVGMNLSRYYSLIGKETFSVGRVQTPTLNIISEREDKIENFVKEKYYNLKIDVENFSLTSDKINSIDEAQDILKNIGSVLNVTEISKNKETTKTPLLYDLTTLQREANKIFGLSAKETLDITQSLYEKKLVTYPRTDSKHLSEDMKESILEEILGDFNYSEEKIKIIFNSKKVTDHHAIVPTVFSINEDIDKLIEKEKKIYLLIKDKLFAAFSKDLIMERLKIIAKDGNEIEYKVSGKTILEKGFTEITDKYKNKKEQDEILPLQHSQVNGHIF